MSGWVAKATGGAPTADEWRGILEQHARWRRGEGGERADLSGANLYGADLSGANLYGADLSGADLSGADLSRANLSGADLSRANLSGADLSGANLYGADLSRADLSRANLSGADLSGAYLSGANLYGADLSRADLSRANLSGADLSGADLKDAKESALAIARTRILSDGYLIGWKKCRDGAIVCLRIPPAARRSHAFGRKCRAEFAEVQGIESQDGKPLEVAYSLHASGFAYRTGETVRADHWNEDWSVECGGGIHFYITRVEAEAHE